MSKYVEKLDDFFTVEGLKSNWSVLAVIAVFMLAVWLRYMPEQGMAYLQALDPYMIFRMAQHLALEGNLPQVDFMRYFPYPTPMYIMNQGDIFIPALLYSLGGSLFFPGFLEWAQFYPALMGGVAVLFAYFLGRELYDNTTGVFSAFFLATIAGVMHRTSAGFFEKEPVGTALMMISLYFFTRAWKRDEYWPGIASGVAMGLFTTSWGGADMLWLLYPLVIGVTLMLNEDVEKMIVAYTPTVVIGAGVAMALNHYRFWLDSSVFLINLGMLGLLWSRYLVAEFELLDREYIKYYTPGVSVIGGVLLLLSPLYSDFLGNMVLNLISKATQSGNTGVIGGTVAENTAAGVGQLIAQLGANGAGAIYAPLGSVGTLLGPWPLAFIGAALLGTYMMFMGLRKFDIAPEEIPGKTYFAGFEAVFAAWVLFFIAFFEGFAFIGFALAAVVVGTFIAMMIYLEEDSMFNLVTLVLGFVAAGELMVLLGGSATSSFAALPATVLVLVAIGFLYSTDNFDAKTIEFKWYYMLPFLWLMSNVLAGVARSRLITLTAFPVAFIAGYTFSKGVQRLSEIEYEAFLQDVNGQQLRIGLTTVIVLMTLVVNGAAGFVSAQQVGGSPNNLWMDNLDYMRNNTAEGDVIMSWWDYGYWFESLGRRAAIADGGNFGYYSSERFGTINYPLADFLTSSNPENHTEFLQKHSVDYIVLDNTMVGKYSAVSQISNRDNSQFQSMITMSTTRDIRNSLSNSGNSTVAQFTFRGLKLYTPIDVEGQGIGVTGAPTLETRQGRIPLNCVLTENGVKTFNVSSNARYCVAEDPFYSLESAIGAVNQGGARRAKMVLVPKKIMHSTLVRLYLMDGHGIDFVEKVPEGSNGYVKMWKVKDLQ